MMASYNEIDGVPSHANKWLLRDVLRKEWGFKGFVVSDYYAIWELGYRPDTHGHFVAKDKKEVVRAGGEGRREHRTAGAGLLPAPGRTGRRRACSKESQLDELVAPMLLWKFQMGLFDDPYVDPDEAERVVGCDAHRELALEAAREAITLLKNENNLAPLDLNAIKTIAVIGPNADRSSAGRLQRRAQARSHGARGHSGRRSASARRCSTARAARSPSAAPGTRTKWSPAIRKKTASRSPKR